MGKGREREAVVRVKLTIIDGEDDVQRVDSFILLFFRGYAFFLFI